MVNHCLTERIAFLCDSRPLSYSFCVPHDDLEEALYFGPQSSSIHFLDTFSQRNLQFPHDLVVPIKRSCDNFRITIAVPSLALRNEVAVDYSPTNAESHATSVIV